MSSGILAVDSGSTQAVPAAAEGDSTSREEVLSALRSELIAADKSGLRGFNESALDVDHNSAVSLELPSVAGPLDRIRRRSELARVHPSSLAPTEIIELPVLSPIADIAEPTYAQSSSVATGVVFAAEDKFTQATDIEFTPSTSTSVAPSVYITEALINDARTVTPKDKASRRLRGRIQFAAMCYSFFLEGWNDGTTGPLLPTIQRHYGVSVIPVLK